MDHKKVNLYDQSTETNDLEYEFVSLYSKYYNEPRDYGNGMLMTMVEVHILTMIADTPGMTVNELAGKWMRTKGAVSQMVSKLEKRGLLYREGNAMDGRKVHFYATDEGKKLSEKHKIYDIEDLLKTRNGLLNTCTDEEICIFYKVLSSYIELFKKNI